MRPNLVYGDMPQGLAFVEPDAVQTSPLILGSTDVQDFAPQSCGSLLMRAPANTLERRHDMALALRALAVGSPFTILAPKDRGGSRLAGELADFGVAVADQAKRHHRICSGVRPETLRGMDAAIADGSMQWVPSTQLFSQPGVFSWDRIDAGSALLSAHLPQFQGRGADLGCGIGVLSRAVLQASTVTSLLGIDLDRRAIEAARLNVLDARFEALWGDVRKGLSAKFDFIVTNPPFHQGGQEDQALGLAFIQVAAQSLRPGGKLWLVANRHLPYEAALTTLFKTVEVRAQAHGYKVFEATL